VSSAVDLREDDFRETIRRADARSDFGFDLGFDFGSDSSCGKKTVQRFGFYLSIELRMNYLSSQDYSLHKSGEGVYR
jgi:hypothetical protein